MFRLDTDGCGKVWGSYLHGIFDAIHADYERKADLVVTGFALERRKLKFS